MTERTERMCFEIGGVYTHPTGSMMHIVGEVDTVLFGKTLVAEDTHNTNLVPVGYDADNAVNWTRVPLSSWYKEWLEGDNKKSLELNRLYQEALAEESAQD